MKRMWSKNEVKNLSKEVIESGQVENAKPIYYHPIVVEFNNGERNVGRLTLLLFNNVSTAYTSITDVFDNIRSWGLTNARIMCSGGCYDVAHSEVVIASVIDITVGDAVLYGITIAGAKSSGFSLNPEDVNFFADAVNKVN